MDWKLTQAAIGQPEIDDYRLDDEGEDLRRGYSLLRELAASDVTLVEISEGVWRHSKLPDAHNRQAGYYLED